MAEQNIDDKENKAIETDKEIILEVKDVKKWFPNAAKSKEYIKAVDGVSLSIRKGETFGLVGESGCGKSTLSSLILSLYKATAGEVYFHGKPVYKMNSRQLREVRREMQVIFQDPYEALDPYLTIEEIIMEPLDIHKFGTKQEKREKVEEMCRLVGLPVNLLTRMPHQLSGGQKQRIAIAGILAMEPDCIIFDEPTAMLDPSGRKEVMRTIKKLNEEKKMTVLHITHYMNELIDADRIIVLDKGKIVMQGRPKEIFRQVDKLKEIGLDVPQMTELAHDLRQSGFNIPDDILHIEEMVNALCH